MNLGKIKRFSAVIILRLRCVEHSRVSVLYSPRLRKFSNSDRSYIINNCYKVIAVKLLDRRPQISAVKRERQLPVLQITNLESDQASWNAQVLTIHIGRI